MNYLKQYQDLMQKAATSKRVKNSDVYECHHILPRSMGGSNHKSNIAILTFREHFVAHLLLSKMFLKGSNQHRQMVYALWFMCKSTVSKHNHIRRENNITSRRFESIRKDYRHLHPNKDPAIKERNKQRREAGLYKVRDNNKVSETLKGTLSRLSDEEMKLRMSKCRVYTKARSNNIRLGKQSLLQVVYPNGDVANFYSWQSDIKEITGYSYSTVKHNILHLHGACSNGNVVKYLNKYQGYAPRRDNSIPT